MNNVISFPSTFLDQSDELSDQDIIQNIVFTEKGIREKIARLNLLSNKKPHVRSSLEGLSHKMLLLDSRLHYYLKMLERVK